MLNKSQVNRYQINMWQEQRSSSVLPSPLHSTRIRNPCSLTSNLQSTKKHQKYRKMYKSYRTSKWRSTIPAHRKHIIIIWWDKFSQKHNYKYMAKWWCLLGMEKLHVSVYSGRLQVLTTNLLKEFCIICLNRVVMLRTYHHFTVFC